MIYHLQPMEIIVLHGDDGVKSHQRLRKFIETAKSRSWEVVHLDESPLTLEENLSSSALFGSERFFILKDIQKLGKKQIDWLKKKGKAFNAKLIIYHPAVVSITLIKNLPPPVKIEEFKLPKLIFEFLQSLKHKSTKETLNLLHKALKTEPPEFVFSLLAKHLRDLYWAKVEPKTLPYPTWRVEKLKKQAEFFKVNQLIELIRELANIDVEVKTSNAEIIPSLDLLIATKLE